MADDTEAARKARAARLHQQIKEMTTQEPPDSEKPAAPPQDKETPAEFIRRKMREEASRKK